MKRRLERLFAADITLAAYHLPLDGHQRHRQQRAPGRGAAPARRRLVLASTAGIPLAVHGTLAAAVPLQTLAERVSEIVGRVPIAFPGGPGARADARDLLGPAGRHRARGRGRPAPTRCSPGEPQEDFRALARELGISIVCAGHHATETLGVRAAGELVSERFGVEHVFIDAPNPV